MLNSMINVQYINMYYLYTSANLTLELRYIKLKAKLNALRIKVKTKTEHCNKSEVAASCTYLKLFTQMKTGITRH